MPLRKRTRNYTKTNVSSVPNTFGVYEILNSAGEVVYIGQGRLRDRLTDHFLGGCDPIPRGARFRFSTTGSKSRAEQRERAELRKHEKSKGKLPSSNKRRG